MGQKIAAPTPENVAAEVARTVGSKPEPLATSADVAKFLGIPEKTLSEWRSRDLGPDYVPVGRYVRYRWAAVISWLEAREIKVAA
jgi:hypothetical protein